MTWALGCAVGGEAFVVPQLTLSRCRLPLSRCRWRIRRVAYISLFGQHVHVVLKVHAVDTTKLRWQREMVPMGHHLLHDELDGVFDSGVEEPFEVALAANVSVEPQPIAGGDDTWLK